MPSSATHNLRQHSADQFYEAFSEASPSVMYVGIGRSTPWTSENSPPAVLDSVLSRDNNTWRELLAVKRVQTSEVSHCVGRINWTTGTVYDMYDDRDVSLFTKSFYVLTDEYNVYKCIDNNGGLTSTVKPTGTTTSIVSTADGYSWKYMYTLTAPEALKWLTTSWIPVKTLSANDSSNQWAVQQAAVDGAMDVIKIDTAGGNYKVLSGTLSTATAGTVTLPNTADALAGTYTGSSIFITAGLGSGQLRKIVAYAGSPTYVCTLDSNWTTTPDVTSNFVLSPTVVINGNGTGATAYADGISIPNGNATSITIVSRGSGYSNTTVTLSANSSHGSGAVLRAIHAPQGGHGSDPIYELGGSNIMMSIKLSGTEGGDFTANNDFRVISLIRDPKYANGAIATTSTLSNLTSLDVGSLVGSYQVDEIITGSTSGATASIVDTLNTGTTLRTVPYNAKSFQVGEIVTGGTSGATSVISTITAAELKQNTGKVLFKDNRVAIQRSADQIEDIRYTLSF